MSDTKPENQGSTGAVSNPLSDPDFRSRPIGEALTQAAALKDAESDKKDDSATSDDKTKTEVDERETEDSKESLSEDKEKGNSGIKKRFAKLTAEKTALKEQNETLLERLERLEKSVGKTGVEPAKSEKAPAVDFKFDKPKPKLDDFDTVADHAEAVANWTYERNRAKEKAEAEVEQSQQTERKTIDSFLERGRALDKELGLEPGEWEETVRGEHYQLPPFAAQAVANMEGLIGAKILYHIASDEGIAERFSKMSDIQKLTFIGKLEAKYESEVEQDSNGGNKKASVTKAKPQGKPIKGSGSQPQKFDRSRPIGELAANAKITSQADYKRLRNK